jgi:hypothetical protein
MIRTGDPALMPRSNGLAGVNPALVVSVGSRRVTAFLDRELRQPPSGDRPVQSVCVPGSALNL